MATNRYVDSVNGSDGNSGVDTDNAWATLEYALENGGLSGGDYDVWWRRGTTPTIETPSSDIAPAYDGTASTPIRLLGAPRNTASISGASWTNGSRTVDLVTGLTLDRKSHQSRYITGPDGETYFITRVIDTNTFTLRTKYAGTTVTTTAGASTIQADADYDLFNAIDDSSFTIKLSTWQSDQDNVPSIDFNDGAFQIFGNADNYHQFYNMEFKDSTDTSGLFRITNCKVWSFKNCLFKQTTANIYVHRLERTSLLVQACTWEGSGAGANQRAVDSSTGSYGSVRIKDSAIYNMGDTGLTLGGFFFFEGLNIGIEIANGDDDIQLDGGFAKGRSLSLGGTNGLVLIGAPLTELAVENYQDILGDTRTFFIGGYYERVAVSGETPNKKNSDFVLKIVPNIDLETVQAFTLPILVQEFKALASAKQFLYNIYNDSGVTLNDVTALDDIYVKLEYISSYDDTSEYVIKEIFSTLIDILDATDADDWDDLSLASVTPAVISLARVSIYWSKYLASTNVFVDPVEVG